MVSRPKYTALVRGADLDVDDVICSKIGVCRCHKHRIIDTLVCRTHGVLCHIDPDKDYAVDLVRCPTRIERVLDVYAQVVTAQTPEQRADFWTVDWAKYTGIGGD